jgi:hypothetical protein
VFEDAAARTVETTLRRNFQTYYERLGEAFRVHDAASQKRQAVIVERNRLRDVGANFIRSQLPGAFSLDLEGALPSGELLTASRLRVGANSDETATPKDRLYHYSSMLGLDREFEAWRSGSLPHLQVQLPDSLGGSPAWVIAGQRDRVFSQIDGDTICDRERLAYHVHERMDGLLALWGAYRLLSGYHALLAKARDAGPVPTRNAARALRRMAFVRHKLADAADARSLSEELSTASEDRASAHWNVMIDFKPEDPGRWRADSLVETIFLSLRDEADALKRTEARVRTDLTVDSSVLAAAASLRLQRTLALLTVLIGILSTSLVTYQVLGP